MVFFTKCGTVEALAFSRLGSPRLVCLALARHPPPRLQEAMVLGRFTAARRVATGLRWQAPTVQAAAFPGVGAARGFAYKGAVVTSPKPLSFRMDI